MVKGLHSQNLPADVAHVIDQLERHCLAPDGSLISKPLYNNLQLDREEMCRERLLEAMYLHASFEEESGFLQFGTSLTSNDAKEIQKFLDQAVSESCEGLIFKPLSKGAIYVTSQKSRIWLKLKTIRISRYCSLSP
ncbi:DNA ligase 1-like [Vicia villosa]|uniref:DNA ligase 1-like n=1 Tax=Vicia villosa TaxID=3911 RepID=UPI00273AF581|nr:DNA ligase 1-like [Vicia villosa]